jgi:hypothetical protein
VPADPALVQRVLASSGVERVPVPPESSYLGELLGTASSYVVDALMAGAKRLHVSPVFLWWVAGGLAVLLALLAVRLIVSRLRRRRPVKEDGDALSAALPPAAPRDAAAWRAELDRRLAEGSIPEALEALWWWLARTLAGGEAEPDWTSRDLVTRSGREDLRDLARRLDAFTYGPRPPEAAELRGLLGRFEAALA